MRLRRPALDYGSFEHDPQSNSDADLARRLTNLLRSIEGGATILFDGGWGVGKTTFVRRWRSQLEKEGIQSVYLDAFAVDYMESPFVAIAGAIAEAASRTTNPDDARFERFLSAASKVGSAIALTATKVALKAATLGALELTDLQNLAPAGETLSDSVSGGLEQWVKERIEEHQKRKGELEALRQALNELSTSISPVQDGQRAPLVVMVDELDRCRPDFALGILESIKHFFGAENVVFVLVCNASQLEASIQKRYGTGVRSEEYLRKFYDLRVHYTLDHNERYGTKLFSIIASINNDVSPNGADSRYIQEYVQDIARAYRLSLRDIEQIYASISLAYATQENLYRPAILVAFLATIKTIAPTLFLKVKLGDLSYSEVEKFVNGRTWRDFDKERLLKVLRWHLDPEIKPNDPEWSGFADPSWRYNLERLSTTQFLANGVIDRFETAA